MWRVFDRKRVRSDPPTWSAIIKKKLGRIMVRCQIIRSKVGADLNRLRLFDLSL
jgi:hypothetical protein